jgi:hypothetical protein
MATPYTTQAKIEAYLKRSLTAYEVTLIGIAIPAVKEYIDHYTTQTFDVDATDTTRYYDGDTCELMIDPITSITSLSYVDSTGTDVEDYVVNDDYYALPRGQAPYTSLRIAAGEFPRGVGVMKLVGKFGRTLPDAISTAATVLVADLIENASSDVKSESIEGYSVTYDSIRQSNWAVNEVLNQYRSFRL